MCIRDRVPTWLSLSDSHHTLSHSSDSDSSGIAGFITAEQWFSEQFGALLTMLAERESPTGGVLLDDTLVVWAKELGDPRAHTCESTPFILAGGGAFTPGRYIDCGGTPHAHLLVSICQAFGLSVETFGDNWTESGPLGVL